MKIGRRIGRAIDVAVFRFEQGPTRVLSAFRDSLLGSALYALTLKGRTPAFLNPLSTAPCLESDADTDTVMAGFLIIGTRRIPFETNAWTALPDEDDIRAAAHGFGWLNGLTGGAPRRQRGHDLLTEWLDTQGRWSAVAWRVDVLADRLSAWAYWIASEMPEGEDDGLRARLLKSFMAQTRHLARMGGRGGPTCWRAFAVCRGLIRSGLALPDGESLLLIGLRRLEAELDRQILPDGGHFQRCPSVHMRVLALLTDMRTALMDHGRACDAVNGARADVPQRLQKSIDQMVPMLRLYRLGDGGLTVVNGGREETRQHVDAVLTATKSKGKGLINAPHAGFQRIQAGATIVVVDSGTPPPPGAQALAHAGPLAFEMSVGPHRLIVNCGAPRHEAPVWTAAMRATAAHSSVTIDDMNAIEFLPGGRIGAAPTKVLSQRRESDDGVTWLDTQHNGYVSTLGVVHRRRFYLDASGEDFRGEDVISGDGGKTFRMRFHLHSDVRASLIQDGTGALLRLPTGAGWRFSAEGGTVSLEDSLYLGGGETPRRSEQIVVSGLLDRKETTVKWRLAKVGG